MFWLQTIGIVSLFPLGVLFKKIFHRIYPSHPLQVNRLRSLSRFGGLFGFTITGVIVASLTLRTRLSSVIGLFSFVIGWRTSVLGLTGGIATGKSTAAKFLESQEDIYVVDADRVARQVVGRGRYAYRKIVETFGLGIIHAETGEINRTALGSIVFADPAKKRKLESITHPAILLEMVKQIVVNRILGRRVIIDVPLLFERKAAPLLYLLCYETLLIDVDEVEQIKRLRRRNPELSDTEIQNRIKSQLPREVKIAIADYVVNNQGPLEELEHQLKVLLE